ncbi:MAG TPA: signal peptidase I [Arachnia sp.]|nr:signal peptidase I [Arachnia sp.]HMT87541.1 signal peptidase I [Arachnia sp.]
MAEEQTPPRRRGLPVWAHFVMAVLVIALVQGLVVKVYRVPSGSMEQTLSVGQMIAVNRNSGAAERGGVWVFNANESWLRGPKPTIDGPRNLAKWGLGLLGYGPGLEHALVKRVVGEGGDTVACCDADGRVTVDGEPLDEPYIYEDYPFDAGTLDCSTSPRSSRCFGPVLVPDDGYLMLGDHRSRSGDSVYGCRLEGADENCAIFATKDDLVGKVIGVS